MDSQNSPPIAEDVITMVLPTHARLTRPQRDERPLPRGALPTPPPLETPLLSPLPNPQSSSDIEPLLAALLSSLEELKRRRVIARIDLKNVYHSVKGYGNLQGRLR